jgi:hypothetical protein
MARKDRSANPAEIQLAIEAAVQDFVGRDWWRTLVRGDGLNELVDMKSCGNLRLPARRSTERRLQKSIGDRTNVGCNYRLN